LSNERGICKDGQESFKSKIEQRSFDTGLLKLGGNKTEKMQGDELGMHDYGKPIANPLVVLREEFDDWAVLFDPDSGNAFGLNPVSVFIWKRLDGRNRLEDILKELRESAEEVPEEAKDHLKEFLGDLVKQGLAGYAIKT